MRRAVSFGFEARGLGALSALVLLAGCSAGGASDSPFVPFGMGGSSAVVGGGGTSVGGSTGDPGPAPVGSPQDPTALCAASEPGPPGLRRLSRRELESTLRDVFPSVGASWASTLSADTISASGFDNDNGMLLVSKQTVREVADTAESVATSLVASLPQVLPCASSAPDAACAGQFLDRQGRQLFRRPLTDAERASYLGFFDTALSATSDFAASVGWLARGLIESPEFLYRREIGALEGADYHLDQYEIATELAYTFSGKGPSNELLDRAARGELGSPDVLVTTARDLLATQGTELVQNFFDSYVGYARVTTIAKVGVEGFAERREEMLNETRRFIDEVVFKRGGGARELFTADFTTPSVQLANFYGFAAAGGTAPATDYAVVQRPAGRGIGLLAQGSVLATLSQPNGSSPTKRGVWIYKHMLCNTVPAVPPNIPELKAPQPGLRTTRQRYAEDHAQGSCQGCHGMWDPIGFGFEHFDEAGRYRETEGGLSIDTKSHVPQNGQDLFQFDGEEDLMTQLVEQPVVNQCLSGYLATYAFGEQLTCAGETRRGDFIDGSIGFIDYLASLAGEPHFTQRRVR